VTRAPLTEAKYAGTTPFPRYRREGISYPLISASDLQAVGSNVRFGSILLKNSFSNDDGKILGVIRRESALQARGIHERVDVAM
jgi:hypothetical protein